jgi:hypothetical protein
MLLMSASNKLFHALMCTAGQNQELAAHLNKGAAVEVDVKIMLHNDMQQANCAHRGCVWPRTDSGLHLKCPVRRRHSNKKLHSW